MLKKLAYGILLMMLVMVVIGVVQDRRDPIDQAPTSRTQAERAWAEDAKRAEEKREAEKPNPQRLAVSLGARQLKHMAHDPASFELVQALLMADGTGCYTYRAKNGFGAVRTGNAMLRDGKITTSDVDGFAGRWNRYCGGKQGVALK